VAIEGTPANGLRQFHVFDQTELAKRKKNGHRA